ncbi:hypothetical protein [Rhodoflexus caldus]|uniref:hypothetical protein n=1 Tax=Rhodoflexus caldus TaxID=2891236 RepID=UPI00202A7B53|nr:hypothetical protein [Rhodoflexus caldus]
MQQFVVQTPPLSHKAVFTADAPAPAVLHITCSSGGNTYMRRDLRLQAGQHDFTVPLSYLPTKYHISIERKEGLPVLLRSYDVQPVLFESNKPISEQDKKFIGFALWMAENMPKLGYKTYQDGNGNCIHYMPKVRDLHTGQIIETPARVDRSTGEIFVSADDLLPATVPMRIFVLLHEYVHYRNQTTNEFECDREAANLYRAQGWPKIEALYALTKFFSKPMADSRFSEIMSLPLAGIEGTTEQERRVIELKNHIERNL